MRYCRVCGREDLRQVYGPDFPGGPWLRCRSCGSDSSPQADTTAQSEWAAYLRERQGRLPELREDARSNYDWFQHHQHHCTHRDFLDIGFFDGSSLTEMQSRGWSVHGFDVLPEAYLGPHTTITPSFQALAMPQQYDAILAREVIEHVDGWRQWLVEVYHATRLGGLFQVQTPRPTDDGHPNIYQRAHRQIFSLAALELELRRIGFYIIDQREWSAVQGGQAWLCRK